MSRTRNYWKRLLVGTSLLLGLTNCGSGEGHKTATGSPARPSKLTIAMLVPEGAERTFEQMETIDKYLSRKLGMPIKTIQLTHASAVIEAMRAKKIDVGNGGAFTYLVAHKNIGAEAIITTATADGNPQFYTSSLITNVNSPVKTIDDVLKHPQTMTLAWAYPTSTSGHLVPRYFLQQHGVKPADFKEVFTSTDHPATVFSAVSGKVDVAAVMTGTLELFIRTGKVRREDVRVLWTSAPIAEGPYFVRDDMDPTLRARIRQAFLDMEREDPKAREVLRTQYTQGMKYIATSDTHYVALREMANKIDGLKLEEK